MFCIDNQACGWKAIACIKVATKEMCNLKGEVATDWHVLCDFSIARDSKLDWR